MWFSSEPKKSVKDWCSWGFICQIYEGWLVVWVLLVTTRRRWTLNGASGGYKNLQMQKKRFKSNLVQIFLTAVRVRPEAEHLKSWPEKVLRASSCKTNLLHNQNDKRSDKTPKPGRLREHLVMASREWTKGLAGTVQLYRYLMGQAAVGRVHSFLFMSRSKIYAHKSQSEMCNSKVHFKKPN